MKTTTLIISLFLFVNISCLSQSLEPEWSTTNTQKGESAWMYALNVDYQNNVYCGTQFGDSLFFTDTIIAQTGYYQWSNWAISKYNNEGDFQSAFDISAVPGKSIFETVIATDKDLNMYVACEFQEVVTLLDTSFNHGSMSDEWSPEILIAKITPDYEIEWTRVISSPTQDEVSGIHVSDDGFIYLAVKHYNNGYSTDSADYFGQDMAVYTYTMCSLLKMDLDGNIVWRKELLSSGPALNIRELIINNDGITFYGSTRAELYYCDNILFHPRPGLNQSRIYIIKTDLSGEFISGKITDWQMNIADIDKDDSDNYYFKGNVWDTLVFGADTIIKHEDTTVYITAKINSEYEPVWYDLVKTRSSQGQNWFNIEVIQDTLYVVAGCHHTTSLFDTVFNTGAYNQTIIGQITPEGVLIKHTVVESQWGLVPYSMIRGNCNNIMISGKYRGKAVIAKDSIQSYGVQEWDGITFKIQNNEPYYFNLGQDTTVCDNIQLIAPEGYEYYHWNDSITEQNTYTVMESGEYLVACVNESGCWIKDTIVINVQPGFTIDIGQDTTISPNDSIYLSIPDIYDSYHWSTGSTENSIVINGEEPGPGTWIVWVDVVNGFCTATDSIQIVINNIPELRDMGVLVYPNPFKNEINILSDKKYEKLELIDFKGQTIIEIDDQSLLNTPIKLNVSEIPAGVYIIKFHFKDFTGQGKLIKL
jgi:type IX secretion system substrate protein